MRCKGTPQTDAATRQQPIGRASLFGEAARLVRDRRGGVAIYAAFGFMLLGGFGVLTLDYGRIVALRGQMQSAADAAALAGATQLDGAPGARLRASALATGAATNKSLIVGGALSIANVEFFRSLSPDVAATGDTDAHIVRVTLTPQTIKLFTKPLLDVLTHEQSDDLFTLSARGAAESAPIVCNAPPLMVCDPTETLGPAADLRDPANAGRQISVSQASTAAPGNYGLLCPSSGNCGASAIEAALVNVNTGSCFGQKVDFGDDVTTAPGNKTGPVAAGIDNRFDMPMPGSSAPMQPAPNISTYPRDSDLSSHYLGNGSWDRAEYWSSTHGGQSLPPALSNASRYQAYLYELGTPYAANGGQTIVPPPDQVPSGFTLVTPPGANLPSGGTPTHASVGTARRTISVTILSCNADNVKGKGTYPTHGRFVDLFLTEPDPSGSGKAIVGEIVGSTSRTNNSNYHSNVRLVQ